MSDSTDVAIEAPKGFVTFERSLQVRPFEMAKASLMIQIPTAPGATVEDIVAASKDSFFAAKATVFEQLNIPFDISAENIVTERLEASLGAVQVTLTQEAAAGASATPSGSGSTVPAKDDLWAELCAHPERWWDNREDKRNAAAPDFKRKGQGEQPALWLEFKGRNNVPEGLTVPTVGFAQRKAA